MRFGVTDSHESASVVFDGILADLFHEELGVAAVGALDRNGTFVASEVLARHDENYMPPRGGRDARTVRAYAPEPRPPPAATRLWTLHDEPSP